MYADYFIGAGSVVVFPPSDLLYGDHNGGRESLDHDALFCTKRRDHYGLKSSGLTGRGRALASAPQKRPKDRPLCRALLLPGSLAGRGADLRVPAGDLALEDDGRGRALRDDRLSEHGYPKLPIEF